MTFDELYPDPLLDLQDQVRDHLETLPFFAAITVLSERSKTLADRVAKTTAKAEGIFVTVLTTEGKATEDDQPGPESDIFVDVSVMEKTITNRKEDTAFVTTTQIVTQLLRQLHYWHPAIALQRLIYKGFAPDAADGESGLLIMTVRFQTKIQFPTALDPVP